MNTSFGAYSLTVRRFAKHGESFTNNRDAAAVEVPDGEVGTCRDSNATFFNLVAHIPMDAGERDKKNALCIT